MIKLTRIYTGDDDESHFEDIKIPLTDNGPIGMLSRVHAASGIIFRSNETSYDYDWHNAPQKQYVILLDGEIEIETSDGEKRRFKGGDIILAEDTDGKGHRSRNIGSSTRRSLFVTIN